MKNPKLLICVFMLLLLFITTSVYAKDTTYFKNGKGTLEEPWLMSDADDMYNLCLNNELWSDYFKVINDIDLSESASWFDGAGYLPIGRSSLADTIIPFSGSFDGGGYELRNLVIPAEKGDYIGLFGYAENAKIENIKLTNLTINNGDAYIGAIVGFGENISIENCHTQGNINGKYDVGGIIGYCNYGEISECSSTCFINGESEIGGLVGTLRYGSIRDCFFAGVSTGKKNIGGICGLIQYSEIIDSYSKGAILAETSGAGIAAYAESSDLLRCYVSGYIGNNAESNAENNVFAILAINENSNIETCFWDLQTTTSNQADADNSDIATGLPTAEMMLKSTYSNWNFGVHWRIKDKQSRPFLQWETVNVNNGSYLNKKIDYAFCAVSDIADEKITDLGMIICDSLDIWNNQYTKHHFDTTAVELNSNRFIDDQIIDGLEFGKTYWACSYAETQSGKFFLGDRIKIIGDDTDTTAVFDGITDIFQIIQSSSILLINIDVPVKNGAVKIFDTLGKEIFAQDIYANRFISIDLSSFSSGIYFCSLFANNTIKTKAFIHSK